MFFPRIKLALPNRYEIPTIYKYFPLIFWVFFCLMGTLAIVAAYFGWLDPPQSPGNVALGFGAFGVFFAAVSIVFWIVYAPRQLLAVEWDNDEVILHPVRGSALQVLWANVAHAHVPPKPRHGKVARAGMAGMGSGVSLVNASVFVLDQEDCFRIALSWDADCMAFLDVLETKVRVTRGDAQQ